MMVRVFNIGVIIAMCCGCGSKEDECMTDSDCATGETCVITHDHEGDDHDHGGTCEAAEADTAE